MVGGIGRVSLPKADALLVPQGGATLLQIQTYLPGYAPESVTGTLSVHVSNAGLWVVGADVKVTSTGDPLAIVCSAACRGQEGESTARDLLTQLLRVLPTVVDAPPFD